MALGFYLFVYAVKIDASMMWRVEKKPIIIGLASFVISLTTGFIASYILYNNIHSFVKHREKFVFFIATLHSHNSAIVLSDILSQLGILNSELGRLALSSAMFQLWIKVGIAFITVFTIMEQSQRGGITHILFTTTLLTLFAFIIFILRPYGLWIVQDSRSNGHVRYLINISK
jgi:Kef-type K+ transport system membrane component KefB